MIEPVLPSNRALRLHFEGLTTDGRTWVHLSLPVRAEGFPDDEGELECDAKKYDARVAERVKLLRQLGEKSLRPSFVEVEAMLRGLSVSSRQR
jgi:hypothetical protein